MSRIEKMLTTAMTGPFKRPRLDRAHVIVKIDNFEVHDSEYTDEDKAREGVANRDREGNGLWTVGGPVTVVWKKESWDQHPVQSVAIDGNATTFVLTAPDPTGRREYVYPSQDYETYVVVVKKTP